MFPNFEKFTLMKPNETITSDSTGNNTLLAVSGQDIKQLIFAIGYTLDAIDVRATDVRRYEAKQKAATILESLMAACASGAVDTVAEEDELLCFCANGGREGLHGICTNCGNYIARKSSEGQP